MATDAELLHTYQIQIKRLARAMWALDTGGTFETMNCGEIEALADVIRLVDAGCAHFVINQHAIGDEEGDLHYEEPDGADLTQEQTTAPRDSEEPREDLLGGAKR